MIVVENLAIQAGTFTLTGLNFTIPAGSHALLSGKSGSGKTTILEAICGLRPVRDGRILLLGQDVTRLKPAERGIGYVPQDGALFATMSVYEHLAFALRIRHWDHRSIARRVEELADLLGLTELLHRRPPGLSGGEAQRVALGRALAASPEILCLDEPMSSLDESTCEELATLLHQVQAQAGITILHVTHHLQQVRHLADSLLVLEDGQVNVMSPVP
ncbi:MAG: ATP-binding cassette domain-containing protein [Armatimonadota bacterium]